MLGRVEASDCTVVLARVLLFPGWTGEGVAGMKSRSELACHRGASRDGDVATSLSFCLRA